MTSTVTTAPIHELRKGCEGAPNPPPQAPETPSRDPDPWFNGYAYWPC